MKQFNIRATSLALTPNKLRILPKFRHSFKRYMIKKLAD